MRALVNRAIDRIVRTVAPRLHARLWREHIEKALRDPRNWHPVPPPTVEVVVLDPCRRCNRYACTCSTENT